MSPPRYDHFATRRLLMLLSTRLPSLAQVKSACDAGADPWACNAEGTSVFELCLRDGRRDVLEAWDSCIDSFQNSAGLPDTVLMMACRMGTMSSSSRLSYIKRLLQKGADPDEKHKGEAFLRSVVALSPSLEAQMGVAWSIVVLSLVARPHLANTFFLDVQGNEWPLVDGLVANAPMMALSDYLASPRHCMRLDWEENPALLKRLHHILSKKWFGEWEAAGFRVSGRDRQGNSLLHHYLRPLNSAYLPNAEGLQILLDKGARWEATNVDNESCAQWALARAWPDDEATQAVLAGARAIVAREEEWNHETRSRVRPG